VVELPSVYGGSATSASTLAVSLKTHSVSKRPCRSRSSPAVRHPDRLFDLEAADYHRA